jgi:hypothetical protein
VRKEEERKGEVGAIGTPSLGEGNYKGIRNDNIRPSGEMERKRRREGQANT